MGKLIAVCGSAGSGKTTFSVKFAETLYHRSHGKHSVIALFCDIVTPSIPVIFPNRKEEDLFSVGSVLSKTDFYADDVVSHMMMTKDRMNLGYLGYLSGENKNSFPEYTEQRAKNFLDVLCEICDYVIVDCMTMPGGNILTTSALEKADHIGIDVGSGVVDAVPYPRLGGEIHHIGKVVPVKEGLHRPLVGKITPDKGEVRLLGEDAQASFL